MIVAGFLVTLLIVGCIIPSIVPTIVTITDAPTPTPTASSPSLSPNTVFIISTIAGSGATGGVSGSYSGDNGPATAATLNGPQAVALDSSGNVYIADFHNGRIRKVTVSTGIINTFAGDGSGTYSGDNGAATAAGLGGPIGVAVDSSGNVYVADYLSNRIRKVTASTGIITTIAGSSTSGSYSGDGGQATAATLFNPWGLTLDSSGNVYIGDNNNNRIRKVTISTGIISTIAGTGSATYSGDNGPATSAALAGPSGVATDLSGNVYIADTHSQRIRKVTVSTGIITTIAGTGTASYSGDNGPATSATLYLPQGVALDATGNVFIADDENGSIRKVTISTGIITTIAGIGSCGYSGDNGPATSAALYWVTGIAVDSSGNVYAVDEGNNRIREVTAVSPTSSPSYAPSPFPSTPPPTPNPTLSPHSISVITTFAGTGTDAYSGDNDQASLAAVSGPEGIVVDSNGNVFFNDFSNHRVRKVTTATGIITTYAGTGSATYSGDGSAATSAGLGSPFGLGIDASDNLYFADQLAHRVRKITASTNVVSLLAGTGTSSFNGDGGPATSATLNYPAGVAVDTTGNVYIGDNNNNRIRKVTISTGIISTIAGTGVIGYSGDNGPATAATIAFPGGVNLDGAGNVYFGDYMSYHVIRKVTVSTGIITTVAGTGSTSASRTGGYNGDNIQATAATLNTPWDAVVDSYGNLYICDVFNHRVRKVTVSTGVITTVAGNGTASSTGDGAAATSASLNAPVFSRFDSAGNYYVSESRGARVRKVITVSTEIPTTSPTYYPTPSPHSISVITTIAGNGSASDSGDGGAATSSTINSPHGIFFDSNKNIYFSEWPSNRVRKITVATGIISTYAGTGASSYSGDGGVATSAGINGPDGLVIDKSDNVYICESSSSRIRMVAPSTGIISTIAGTGATSYSYTGDGGPATSATFTYPTGIAVDASDNLYFGEGYARIRKITASTGLMSTVAGMYNYGYSGDGGPATAALVAGPHGISLDSVGNIYFPDQENHVVRKVTVSTGIISTVAGFAVAYTSGGYNGDNIQATSALLNNPHDVVLDSYGNLYISDRFNNRIRKVTVSTGVITTVIGDGTASSTGDGASVTSATVSGPCYNHFDSAGNFFISECEGNRIRKVVTVSTEIPTTSPTYYPSPSPHSISVITTIAGNGSASDSGDGGAATSSTINEPAGIVVDSSGNVYFSDCFNHRVRKITAATGIINTYAGTGDANYTGDGVAASSTALSYPNGLGMDSAGNVYVSETGSNRVRKVAVSTGIISTVAGTSGGGYNGDNMQATSASLLCPVDVALDSADNIYLSDGCNHRIRKVLAASAVIITVAGSGVAGYAGDGAAATAALIYYPHGIDLDSVGNIYIGDYYANNVVRKVTVSTGIISTVAGTASTSGGYNGDNIQATAAMLHSPHGVTLDNYGNLYICDRFNYRIRKVDVLTGVITTVIGNGTRASTGDGAAASAATISLTCYSRFDSTGNYYISECGGNRVRKVITVTTYIPTATPTMIPSGAPTSLPTSSPTKLDIVAANIFNIPLNGEVARVKVQYYLGTFVGYFLAIYICLYLFSFLRYGKVTATQLYDASYRSEVHVKHCANSSDKDHVLMLTDLCKKNALVLSTMQLEEHLKLVQEASSKKLKKREKVVSKYSKAYREYVQQQRTLLGCGPFLYPEGYVLKIPCVSREVMFPPGRVENILLFICHNHPLFSCFYFMDGSKLGAHGTRILYIGKDIAVFVLYQFSNVLLQYFMLDRHILGPIINLFVITPSAVTVGLLLKYLYTCPFTETVEFQRKYAAYETAVLCLGRLAIAPIMLIMTSSLIIACLFSSDRNIALILVNYFIYVQFYGILLAVAKAVLLFMDGYYYHLTLFGVFDILHIGRLYKERILAEKLVVDVDYAYRDNTYLFGVARVQKILNRDDAIKARWITAEGGCDIEMNGSDEAAVVENPLMIARDVRTSTVFSMDAIYGSSMNEEGDYLAAGGVDVVENPIYQSVNRHELLRLHQSAINSTTEDASVVEDDATLYLEYQNLQSQRDDAVYSMTDDDAAISFEEWKTRRKQFKQGTRGSFVKAFQVFEEREQLARDIVDQSASVKNTMHLHSFKNALARPK